MKKEEIVKVLKGFVDVHWERLSKSDLEKVMNALNDFDSLKKVIDLKDFTTKLIKKRGEKIAEKFVDKLLERWLL